MNADGQAVSTGVPGGARLLAVNTGQVVEAPWAGRLRRTAIGKRPAAGPVWASESGLAGDEQADRAHHGGTYQAAYAYAEEDALFWADRIGRAVPPGAFGENLTTIGVDVSGAVVGERWQVGEAVLQVTAPRIPCQVFAAFSDVPDLIKQFTAAARPGAYLRVVEPGRLRSGDPVRVVHRPDHGVTVRELARARAGDRSLLPRLRELAELPPAWQSWVRSASREPDREPAG